MRIPTGDSIFKKKEANEIPIPTLKEKEKDRKTVYLSTRLDSLVRDLPAKEREEVTAKVAMTSRRLTLFANQMDRQERQREREREEKRKQEILERWEEKGQEEGQEEDKLQEKEFPGVQEEEEIEERDC